ncbi:hypothetical protein Btru_025518 [Bulinus truncatus]|nr:hypothetical protein Btru_025518 [Bulinus truncatus]
MDVLDDMDKKLLKSLLNEECRGVGPGGADRRGAGGVKKEDGGGGGGEEKTRGARTPLNETKARGGRRRQDQDDSMRRQDSRFDRSMRVLEWLDADCGTRLAKHYEQAGGWRHHGNIYLPQKTTASPKKAKDRPPEQTAKKLTSNEHQQQQQQQTLPPQQRKPQPQQQPPRRQPLRLTRSNIIIGNDLWYGYVKDSEEDSSSSDGGEEEKKILEESEEDLNDQDGDDENLVESLKKWQQERLLVEHHEDLSMQEYVTSSDEDPEDESDSEDELVLALRHWQEEQQRQQLRQASLAQIPKVLTPVLEEKTSSPLNEAFKHFYQDPNYLLCHFNKQRLQNHQQVSAIAPYWWGDISSVREGPSSPPVNSRNSDAPQPVNTFGPQRRGPRNASFRSRAPRFLNSSSNKEGEVSFKDGQVTADHTLQPASSPQSLSPTTPVRGRAPSPLPSPLPSPTPLDIGVGEAKSAGGGLDSVLTKVTPAAVIGSTTRSGDEGGLKTIEPVSVGAPPHSPLLGRSPGGNFLPSWLTTPTVDKQSSPLASGSESLAKSSECIFEGHREHILVCSTNSTNSQDSGIERSPGYLSPAPRSAGIEKIGKFFRHFSNKLSPTLSSSAPPKTPPPTPTTPGRQQYSYPQQQSINAHGGGGGAGGKLSSSTSSIPAPTLSSSLLRPTVPPSPVAGAAASQHLLCSVTKSDPLAGGTTPKRHAGLWRSGHQQQQLQPASSPLMTAGRSHAKTVNNSPAVISLAGEISQNTNAGFDGYTGAGTGGGGIIISGGSSHRPVAESGGVGNIAVTQTINTFAAESCASDRQKSPGGPNSNVSKAILSTKDVQPFIVPQTYQSHYTHLQFLAPRKAAGDAAVVKRGAAGGGEVITEGGNAVEAGSQSNSRSAFRDNSDSLKKSGEWLDAPVQDNEALSGAGSSGSGGNGPPALSGFTRGVQQFLRRSPVSDIEQKIQSDSVERDPQGKFKSLLNLNTGVSVSGAGAGAVAVDIGSVSAAQGGATGAHSGGSGGDHSCHASAKPMTDQSKKSAAKEEVISSRCSERSSSTSSEEKVTLPVPNTENDNRGRRGSHGTCNHLFLEQASGRKSPLLQKVRKSPSPVRRALFKSVVNSSNSSSSSSADSSSKLHPKAGRVFSSSSPSSPPPQQQSSPLKTSPKHLTSPHDGLDSPTKKNISSDSPPANYRGRRKFSDTGLTPVPRRLFNDGRRGSLTDERTLVSAKSKLGKLRFQGRKSSDASSVAALVKQIHNLWGEGEDDEEEEGGATGSGERNIERRDSSGGLKCSLDDQVLFDKRRRKFPFSLNKDKDGASGEKNVGNKINASSGPPLSSSSSLVEGGSSSGPSAVSDSKNKGRNVAEKDVVSIQLQPPFTNASVTNVSSAINSGEQGCQTSGEVYRVGLSEGPSGTNETTNVSSLETGGGGGAGAVAGGGVIGNCGGAVGGSEFVAPIAQVASRQLLATAVSSAACFVGLDASTDNILTRASGGAISGSQHIVPSTGSSGANTAAAIIGAAGGSKTGKKTATVQFDNIVSWDDNTVRGKVSPALRSVLKQGARRHSSFAGFSADPGDNISNATPIIHSEQLAAVLSKQAKNGLPKSKTSDNYKSILKQSSVNLDSVPSSATDKKRAKSPSPKSRKNEKTFDYGQETKTSEVSLSLCLKATRSLSPKSKKCKSETKDAQESCCDLATTPLSSSDKELQTTDSGHCSLDLPTKTVGVQATPRTIGKTSNTGTQTTDPPSTGEVTAEFSSSPTDAGGWLQRLAAKCMASVGGANRSGSPGGPGGGLPRAASVRAEWLLGSKRMGSSPSSPVAPGGDASEKFWVPHDVIARKRAQSLVPTLSKQESEDVRVT